MLLSYFFILLTLLRIVWVMCLCVVPENKHRKCKEKKRKRNVCFCLFIILHHHALLFLAVSSFNLMQFFFLLIYVLLLCSLACLQIVFVMFLRVLMFKIDCVFHFCLYGVCMCVNIVRTALLVRQRPKNFGLRYKLCVTLEFQQKKRGYFRNKYNSYFSFVFSICISSSFVCTHLYFCKHIKFKSLCIWSVLIKQTKWRQQSHMSVMEIEDLHFKLAQIFFHKMREIIKDSSIHV